MKKRLDQFLLDKNFVSSRSQASMLIKKGDVFVNNQLITKAGKLVSDEDEVKISSDKIYVGRGAYKLLKAIEEFSLDFKNKIIADCGASTGGFTEVSLEKGASKVYAIDVGHGQLHPRLINDARVINLEGINLKEKFQLEEKVDIGVVDLSFISISKVLSNIFGLIKEDGQLVVLFKPQFEVGKKLIGKKGVVNTENAKRAVEDFERWLNENNYKKVSSCHSPIQGKDGNEEYLYLIKKECI